MSLLFNEPATATLPSTYKDVRTRTSGQYLKSEMYHRIKKNVLFLVLKKIFVFTQTVELF
jgi:hypothetical protein